MRSLALSGPFYFFLANFVAFTLSSLNNSSLDINFEGSTLRGRFFYELTGNFSRGSEHYRGYLSELESAVCFC